MRANSADRKILVHFHMCRESLILAAIFLIYFALLVLYYLAFYSRFSCAAQSASFKPFFSLQFVTCSHIYEQQSIHVYIRCVSSPIFCVVAQKYLKCAYDFVIYLFGARAMMCKSSFFSFFILAAFPLQF